MNRNYFLLYFLLFLLIIAMGNGSFWTGMFSVAKFIVVLIGLISLTLIIKLFLVYRKMKKFSSGIYEDRSSYSESAYRANPRSEYSARPRWTFFYRGTPRSQGFYNVKKHTDQTSPQPNPRKVIEICPICGYEKDENHICKNPN